LKVVKGIKYSAEISVTQTPDRKLDLERPEHEELSCDGRFVSTSVT
jgi:hypothetical protein